MNEKEKMLDKYLSIIASNLDISETMWKKAEASYRAVGQWLGDCSGNFEVKIMPQGSFNLGTIIRPISDEDEYDIDLVCLLKDAAQKNEAEIKNVVGNRLKENHVYQKMLQKEGKRCWTLCYDEFHMDILPCVPDEGLYAEPYFTKIKLTHKLDNGIYIPKYSNPYNYHEWFENRMKTRVLEMRKEFAVKNNVDIDNVPLYKIKTPLQRAIQLLKRHRDVMYDKLPESRKNNAPISIIITTLAGHAYNNESNVIDALKNIIDNMGNYIEKEGDTYVISNPSMPSENFADKWKTDPDKVKEFFSWMKCIKSEMITELIDAQGLNNLSNNLKTCFGDNIVQRSMKEEGYTTKSARENKSLYIDGLKGGLQTNATNSTRKVGGHTFFGK